MFDKYLGISKQTFLDHHVVPANDNDRLKDNKCSFCWDAYHEDHHAVRVLPCNHVFGRECLITMINAPNGDLCPICRAPLFRPALRFSLKAWIVSGILRLCLVIISLVLRGTTLIHTFSVSLDCLPFGAGGILRGSFGFYIYSSNVFFYSFLLIDSLTDLQGRNPQLKIGQNMAKYWLWMFFTNLATYPIGGYITIPKIVRLSSGILFILITNWSKIPSYKDRFIFGVVVLVSLLIGLLVAAISPVKSLGIRL
ncbi:hypothetical protein DE146DRAFT_758222 [Phaeosphaeria sp. MPI-PUGE-AT-0046c]|nr:hypothetical protein DE146DRAFT_758222 [Phaeosphaeria sp. MPI-PUGE-AT-0046c]